MNIKRLIHNYPPLHPVARMISTLKSLFKSEFDSGEYWEKRYRKGGTSGAGSYNEFAEYKASVINNFVFDEQITTVIDYGCGDGNQLLYFDFPEYIGFDVSAEAVECCRKKFVNDKNKTFKLMNNYENETAQLTISLEVIFHLIEDEVFYQYMNRLFNSSMKFVIIYSSSTDKQYKLTGIHEKHRDINRWIQIYRPEWRLKHFIPNEYPYNSDTLEGSYSDFYIYERVINRKTTA